MINSISFEETRKRASLKTAKSITQIEKRAYHDHVLICQRIGIISQAPRFSSHAFLAYSVLSYSASARILPGAFPILTSMLFQSFPFAVRNPFIHFTSLPFLLSVPSIFTGNCA